ncbi:patatin-like phospholipase family protein [Limibaculum sp. M0105]|uniref:Patatin-like phospholipase family protein n=1 Tax=Thermohalobaculum xanthum TaxID=2753746 RepID=A0A8J7M6B6_9RHOB|nr:patatin-like phospholipase family protein [Thermohalobaculum xanthum]MBK0399036.1 patatin-like phospholipase family protein [Thermohalobaculum xanthum]
MVEHHDCRQAFAGQPRELRNARDAERCATPAEMGLWACADAFARGALSSRAVKSSISLGLVLIACVSLAGCGAARQRNPVPNDLIEVVEPVGFHGVRLWGDYNEPEEVERMMLARAEILRERFGAVAAAGKTPRLRYLAISGGGQYGAFAAGILTEWSRLGTRPEFDAVTGISTGAIIAPFAFLGPRYDNVLTEIYTTFSTEDLVERRIFSGVVSGASLLDTAPLREKIARYVTPAFLDEVGEEHRRGRLLLVGTTNIDAGRSVIWNMGAIAASGKPGALELFHEVIVASAAIPMAFPPAFFEVEAGGETFEEMHVDGGVTSQVNALSPQIPHFMMQDLVGFDMDRELYLIVNGAVTPPPKTVAARTHEIAGASIDALWYAQAVGDLYKVHSIATRDEIAVHYAWIPESFRLEPEERFDPVFMRALFDLGGDLVSGNALWQSYPPGFTVRTPSEAGSQAAIAARR